MEYTQKMEDLIWKFNGEDVDVKDIQAFLNRPEEFYSFGENLSRIIRRKMPLEEKGSPGEFLLKCCKRKGLTINRNTVANWLSKGLRPKKSDESRENMFKVAFALGLSAEGTDELFHHVYLDRSFNFRRENEFIYCYCIETGKTYQHAQDLLTELSNDRPVSSLEMDQTIATKLIGGTLETLPEDEDVLQYIKDHPHNFGINNQTATDRLNECRERAREAVQEELERKGDEKKKNESIKSDSFMFRVITGQSFSEKSNRFSLTGKFQLVKEISANFPQPQTLSKLSTKSGEKLSYDEIRKLIILFYSYWYWEKAEEKKGDVEFDEFESGLSNLLNDINFPPLYYGNPHDWFYLYCATTENPLDTFRGILAEALDKEE